MTELGNALWCGLSPNDDGHIYTIHKAGLPRNLKGFEGGATLPLRRSDEVYTRTVDCD